MARKYTPFQKIIGEQNADKLEFYGGLKNVIITEKIHGCNFSVCIYKNDESNLSIWFAARNHLLGVNEKFQNYQRYFTNDFRLKLMEAAMKVSNIFNTEIRLVGELYAGQGPLAVQKSKILYDGDVNFKLFHIIIDDQYHCTWPMIKQLAALFQVKLPPIIQDESACKDDSLTLHTLYTNTTIGFSKLCDDPTVSEGYCFRIDVNKSDDFNEIQDEKYKKIPIIFKKRSPDFLETIQPIIIKKLNWANKSMEELNDIVINTLTTQRFSNILSKGYDKSSLSEQKLAALYWTDVMCDYNFRISTPDRKQLNILVINFIQKNKILLD